MLPNKPGKKRVAPWLDDYRTWYQLEIWRRRRRRQLQREPLCEVCIANGLVVVATVADHIVHHNAVWNKFLTDPLQSLCFDCHNSKHNHFQSQHEQIGIDGWPIDYNDVAITNKQKANAKTSDSLIDNITNRIINNKFITNKSIINKQRADINEAIAKVYSFNRKTFRPGGTSKNNISLLAAARTHCKHCEVVDNIDEFHSSDEDSTDFTDAS